MEEQERAYTHTPFPQQLVIETTAGCNMGCIFCGRTYMARPKKTMDRKIFDKIVEEVASESPYTEIWPTFMGESMLLGDKLFDMLAYARKVGCKKITLNSNGTRLNEHHLERILEGNLDRFIISCDAFTPQTHALVRPITSTFKEENQLGAIFQNMQALIKKIQNRNLTRPIIEMQFSIFDENQHEVEDFKKFWMDQGVTVKVRPKVHWSGTVKGGEKQITLKDRKPCLWAFDSAAITWNGNVVMCPIDCDGKYVAGNVTMQSLKEIWNGPLKWTRELHRQRRFGELPQVCRECPDWEVKKAHAYFPDDSVKKEYEDYVTLGRTFMESHFWQESQGPVE
jgi:radical SAM protein with 4Fe4S-binding SPASM domain